MWKVIKKYVLSEPHQELCEIEVNNIKINNYVDISNKLNDFFADSVIKINESIPNLQYSDNKRETIYSLHFRLINVTELEQKIKNMYIYKSETMYVCLYVPYRLPNRSTDRHEILTTYYLRHKRCLGAKKITKILKLAF